MKISLFDYRLPKSRIAQASVRPRDMSKLMVLDRAQKKVVAETRFRDIGRFLRSGDLLIVNDTKVFRARIFGALPSGARIELFLLRPSKDSKTYSLWEALARPAKKLVPGKAIRGSGWEAAVETRGERGEIVLRFPMPASKVFALLEKKGQIPVPPYIGEAPKNEELYQTVYAEHRGSVAAPTAGFHFTKRLMKSLEKKGIAFASVTLHVGLGTFQPIVSERLEEHRMHAEWGEVSASTLRAIRETKKRGGRVISVGTTTLRALEGLVGKKVTPHPLHPTPLRGWIDIFITPGYRFKVADGLITNFHLPHSTLLVLVSAFSDRDFILRAYRRAIRKKYRFYSFGDAMFLV